MPPPEHDHVWAVRAGWMPPDQVRAYARTHAFSVGHQASVRDSDPHPSAIEYLLGALAADLVLGFRAVAARRAAAVRALELSIAGRLDNILVHLGVIGETGHPGLESITGTLYVDAEMDGASLEDAWSETLERSPLFNTLSRCAALSIAVRPADMT